MRPKTLAENAFLITAIWLATLQLSCASDMGAPNLPYRCMDATRVASALAHCRGLHYPLRHTEQKSRQPTIFRYAGDRDVGRDTAVSTLPRAKPLKGGDAELRG
jgi:hypothetical protein